MFLFLALTRELTIDGVDLPAFAGCSGGPSVFISFFDHVAPGDIECDSFIGMRLCALPKNTTNTSAGAAVAVALNITFNSRSLSDDPASPFGWIESVKWMTPAAAALLNESGIVCEPQEEPGSVALVRTDELNLKNELGWPYSGQVYTYTDANIKKDDYRAFMIGFACTAAVAVAVITAMTVFGVTRRKTKIKIVSDPLLPSELLTQSSKYSSMSMN